VYFQGLTVWHRLLDIDEANYGAIAALMNAGGRLYADGGVDNKAPVVFWVYAAAFRLFGLYNLTAVHVFKVAVVLATAGVLAAIAKHLGGRAAAWIAALLYIAFSAAGYPKLAAANTEVLMMLPLSLSFLLLLRRRWVAAAALLALACFTKQVAVLQLALFPLAALLERSWRPLLLGTAGFAAGLAVLVGVLALGASVTGWWHWTVASVLTSYGPSAWSGGQLASAIEGGLLPWIEAAIGLLLAALAGLRRAAPLLAGWLLTAGLGALAGGHFFGHYFIELVGPAAVLAAGFLANWRWASARPARAALVTGLLAAPAVLFTAGDYSQNVVPANPVDAYLAAHTAPGARIFVWGDAPDVYVYAGRLPATRFSGFLRGLPRGSGTPPVNWDTTPEVWSELEADFAAHPAALIADTSTAGWNAFGPYPMSRFPQLAAIVSARYVKQAVVDGVTIYRLR
jgi:hypothetical protein